MVYRFLSGPRFRNACAAAVGVAFICGAMMSAKAVDVSAVATTGQAAVVTVRPNPADKDARAGQAGSLIVNVVGFKPPPAGSVQAVVTVKAPATGETHEIGRFGLFPNSEFKAKGDDETQKFRLTLNPAAARLLQQQGKVSIDLLPHGGSGDGARLEIGMIDVQTR